MAWSVSLLLFYLLHCFLSCCPLCCHPCSLLQTDPEATNANKAPQQPTYIFQMRKANWKLAIVGKLQSFGESAQYMEVLCWFLGTNSEPNIHQFLQWFILTWWFLFNHSSKSRGQLRKAANNHWVCEDACGTALDAGRLQYLRHFWCLWHPLRSEASSASLSPLAVTPWTHVMWWFHLLTSMTIRICNMYVVSIHGIHDTFSMALKIFWKSRENLEKLFWARLGCLG